MTEYWYLADAHSFDSYCDGAETLPKHHHRKSAGKSVSKASSIHTVAKKAKKMYSHHHKNTNPLSGYNPYSTISQKRVNSEIAAALAEAHRGGAFADGALA